MKQLTPQEVRLGNLTSHGVVVSVDRQRFRTIDEKGGQHDSFNTADIHPVPLTPEILEGFGFEKGLFDLLTLFTGKHILTFKQELIYIDDFIIVPNIQHAHTLQNFVQSISGVELVYKQKMNNTK